jgi:DNA invertase Pin-like site-specific DNA recombinase
MKTGGILLRVSTKKQAEEGNATYRTQLQDCLKYAKDHDIEVPDDAEHRWQEVSSRDKFYTRDGLQAALDAIKEGRIQALIVWKLDRLTDSLKIFNRINYDYLDEYHAELWSATETEVDLTTDDGYWMAITLMHFKVSKERSTIRLRTMRNRHTYTEEGRPWASNRPRYGYKWVQDPARTVKRGDAVTFRKEKLEPDPETAPVVQQVFQWADAGHALRWISRVLSGSELVGKYKQPTPSQHANLNAVANTKGEWDTATVYGILRFEGYAGKRWPAITTRHERRENDDKERTKTIHLPESEWTWIEPSPAPGLVSTEQWERVQVRLGNNQKYSPRSTERKYGPEDALLYGGMARCGVIHEDGSICGKRLTPRPREDGSLQYRCIERVRTHPGCRGVYIAEAILDEAVIAALAATLQHPDNISRLARSAQQKELAKSGGISVITPIDKLAALEKRLAKEQGRLQNFRSMSGDPDLDEHTRLGYKMDAMKQTAEVQRLEEDCERARKAAAQYKHVEDVIVGIEHYLKQWKAQSESMALGGWTRNMIRQCLEALGGRVIVHPHSDDPTQPIATLQLHFQRLDFGATMDDEQGAVNIPVSPAPPQLPEPSPEYLEWFFEDQEDSSVSSSLRTVRWSRG